MAEKKNTKQITLEKLDLSSTFGMCEMEVAAVKILNLMIDERQATVSIDQMEDNSELIGFVELVNNRYLKKISPYYNGCFAPTEDFYNIVKRKTGIDFNPKNFKLDREELNYKRQRYFNILEDWIKFGGEEALAQATKEAEETIDYLNKLREIKPEDLR